MTYCERSRTSECTMQLPAGTILFSARTFRLAEGQGIARARLRFTASEGAR